ncbi:hypothetical protein VTJ04DRAFT_5445 [Mycothermus thermophilus]|uniref:uncharacterized protein n=1 Tax=Humicola insolens TaxID=85995 RepID=UPI003742F41D
MGGLQTCPDEGGRRRCDETEDEKVKDSLATEEEARDGVKEGRNNDGRDSPDTTRGVRGVVVGVRYLFFLLAGSEFPSTSIDTALSRNSRGVASVVFLLAVTKNNTFVAVQHCVLQHPIL